MNRLRQFISQSIRSRRVRLIVALWAGAIAGGWLIYFFMFQSLPQSAINLLPDIQTPTAGDRILVFSPHPDDESIAAGGFIAASVQHGAAVWVVLVTNGDKHGIETVRYEEFNRALDTEGVPATNRFFLGYPDGSLAKQNQAAVQTRFATIVNQVKPTIIVAPTTNDEHPDHAATGILALNLATTDNITLYQYLVHHRYFPASRRYHPNDYLLPPAGLVNAATDWNKFALSTALETTKYSAVKQYRSQLRVPLLNSLIMSLVRRNELFVVRPASKIPAPMAAGGL